ncbi:MAG: C13 family peptidase [Pseudomonadota bacterium]
MSGAKPETMAGQPAMNVPTDDAQGSTRASAAPVPTLFGLLVLAVFVSSAWVLLDWFRADADSRLFLPGLAEGGWHVALLLLAIAGLGALSRPGIGTRRAAALLLSAVAIALLIDALIDWLLPAGWINAVRWLLLFAVSIWVARRTRRLAADSNVSGLLLLCFVTLSLLFGGLNRATGFYITAWWPAELLDYDNAAAANEETLWRELEPILFAQPSRIDVALSMLAYPATGNSAYFVGFAGYGEEKVFAEEIKFAASVAAERFGTKERSLLLINDQRDLASRPLASGAALTYALRELGKRMKVEDDLLVLALSSHGSRDPSLAVSNGLVPVRDLSAATLRRALDRAGIRWRVLIISACYSGAFIEELATPESIIIAAAAPDRTSFGCSNDRDLTYFGEAFLRDSLLYLPTLEEAFEQARVLVTAREKAFEVEPSYPVAYFGSAISDRIGQWLRPPCEPAAPDLPHSSGCRSKSRDP